MNKQQFLEQAVASALPLHPKTIHGVSFFVRETAVMDVRIAMDLRVAEATTFKMARQLATVMLSDTGKPLFDPLSDDDMQALTDALDSLPASFASEVNKARAEHEKPLTPEEVDPAGN
jgi:hypothetical protein